MLPPRKVPFYASPSTQQPSQPPEAPAANDDEAVALAVSDQRTLYIVNIFIGNTARFLNSFASICQDKLADVHRRILKLDANLTLLEAQLRRSRDQISSPDQIMMQPVDHPGTASGE